MSNRKELVRAYKQTVPQAGVYVVRNKKTGKVLLGSSVNVDARINRQKAELSMGGHQCEALAREWKELGPDAFEFEVLETVEVRQTPGFSVDSELKKLEAKWIEKLQPLGDDCYNTNLNIRNFTY